MTEFIAWLYVCIVILGSLAILIVQKWSKEKAPNQIFPPPTYTSPKIDEDYKEAA